MFVPSCKRPPKSTICQYFASIKCNNRKKKVVHGVLIPLTMLKVVCGGGRTVGRKVSGCSVWWRWGRRAALYTDTGRRQGRRD